VFVLSDIIILYAVIPQLSHDGNGDVVGVTVGVIVGV
jgi:hypothetical protein